MEITANALKDIMSSFPPAPPEHGGIIGGKNGIVSVFCYDNAGLSEQAVYIPDTVYLNNVIKKWYRSGISFFGIIHSHLRNEPSLSTGDIQYIETIMSGMEPGEKLYFPIVLPDCVIPYIAIKTETSVNIKKDVLNVHSE